MVQNKALVYKKVPTGKLCHHTRNFEGIIIYTRADQPRIFRFTRLRNYAATYRLTRCYSVWYRHATPTEMPVVGEHIAVQDWPIDAESDLKDGSILVKVRLRRKANPVL